MDPLYATFSYAPGCSPLVAISTFDASVALVEARPAVDAKPLKVLADLGYNSRGAVDGAWGRRAARALLQLLQEDQ